MYNLRYHLASLLGVFLALALGLVLGGLVVESGGLDQQRSALISGLQEEFADIRQENATLSDQNDMLTTFSAEMTDVWTAGRLADRTVLVIAPSPDSEGISAAVAGIQAAGGTAAVVTISEPGLGLSDEELRSQITSATGKAARASVIASLAAEWSAPGPERPLTARLADADVLSVEDLNGSAAASGVIVLEPAKSGADAVAMGFVNAFETGKTPVIGAQATTSKGEFAFKVSQDGRAAFDTLGTDVGRYTMVALLAGAQPAYYGTGERAVSRFPDPNGL